MRFCTAVWWRWKSRPPPYSASWSWDGPGCQQSPLPSPRWSQSPSKNTVFNDIKVYVRIITSVFQDGNIITVHRWLIFMYLHHFISTDAAVTIDIIEVKRPDNLRRKILIEKFFVRRKKFRLSKLPPPLPIQYHPVVTQTNNVVTGIQTLSLWDPLLITERKSMKSPKVIPPEWWQCWYSWW